MLSTFFNFKTLLVDFNVPIRITFTFRRSLVKKLDLNPFNLPLHVFWHENVVEITDFHYYLRFY